MGCTAWALRVRGVNHQGLSPFGLCSQHTSISHQVPSFLDVFIQVFGHRSSSGTSAGGVGVGRRESSGEGGNLRHLSPPWLSSQYPSTPRPYSTCLPQQNFRTLLSGAPSAVFTQIHLNLHQEEVGTEGALPCLVVAPLLCHDREWRLGSSALAHSLL